MRPLYRVEPLTRGDEKAKRTVDACSEYARRPPEGATSIGTPPAAPFFITGRALFLAEMFRRVALYSRIERKFSRGNTSFRIRPVSLAVRVLWMLVTLEFYTVLTSLAGGVGGILSLAAVRGGNDTLSVEAVRIVAVISISCGVLACLATVATPRSGARDGDAESVV